MIDAPTLSNWYDLLSRVMSDLQSERAKRRQARLKDLSALFRLIQRVQADYVAFFVKLKEDCRQAGSDEALSAAKEAFFVARARHSGDRALLHLDTMALRKVYSASENFAEQRFLAAISNYLSAYEYPNSVSRMYAQDFDLFGGADALITSTSSLFWLQLKSQDDPERIAADIDKTLEWLGRSYAAVAEAYSFLDGSSGILASGLEGDASG